jgi:hypothetical protein
MDGPSFDRIAKALAAAHPRRRVLALLGGAGLAGAGRLLLGQRPATGAASHLCCTYRCGETFRTSCSRQGACPPPPVGCSTQGGGYFVARCKDCQAQVQPPTPIPTNTPTPTPTNTPTPTATATPCPAGEHCSGGRCCPEGEVACPGNPAGCIPAGTACSGEPVCCSDLGLGSAIVCGFMGACQAGSAPPPATCPSG